MQSYVVNVDLLCALSDAGEEVNGFSRWSRPGRETRVRRRCN